MQTIKVDKVWIPQNLQVFETLAQTGVKPWSVWVKKEERHPSHN